MTNSLQARLDNGFDAVQSAIDEGRIPGAVLGISDINGSVKIRSAGMAQTVGASRVMTDDTWFDLASLTKVLFTTPRILALCLEGKLDLDAPLSSVLKDLRQYQSDCWERKITFRQCLAHQTPLPAVEPLYTYGQDPQLLRAFILQREWVPGEPVYSDINFILLGFALERLEGMLISEMDPGNGFAFFADPSDCAATEDCTWRQRVLCGEVHDDNCAALQGAGHAGLFGTARAILRYAQSLLSGSRTDNELVRLIRTPMSETRTLGWQCLSSEWSAGRYTSNHSNQGNHAVVGAIGHTGFTGTGLWVDFDAGLAWTLLTNRIHPSRHFDSGIDELRRTVGNLVLS